MGIDYETVEHIAKGIQNLGPKKTTMNIQEVIRFKQANQRYGRFLNVYSCRNPYACSMCIHSFSLAVKSSMYNPRYWLTFIPKFAYYALFKHMYIVQGRHAEIPDVKGKIICLGDCTKKIAEKNHLTHINGCPPDSMSILKHLLS